MFFNTKKIGGMIEYLGLEEFWSSLTNAEQQDLIRYDKESLKVGVAGSGKGSDLISGKITYSSETQLNLLTGFLTWTESEKNYSLADKLVEQGEKSLNERKGTAVNAHFFLQTAAELFYKQRDLRSDAIDKTIELCTRDMKMFPEYSKELKRELGFIPRITTFQRMAILLEKQGRFKDAISVCELAIKYGLEDGTKGGYEGRLEKLKKKLEKQQ